MGCVRVFICKKWSYAIGRNMVTKKTKITYLNGKRPLITWGLRVPICKINFCSRVLRLSELLNVGKGRKLPYAAQDDKGNWD